MILSVIISRARFVLTQGCFYSYYFSPTLPFTNRKLMDLSSVIRVLEKHIPPNLAESWDNTGLLIEPSKTITVSTIFFTNDLTEAVLNEAILKNANLIISYHPPIFTPIKSLKTKNWKDRIVIKCIENYIAVYSPHTASDAVGNGVNSWLINCFDVVECQPIQQSFAHQSKYSHVLEFTLNHETNITDLLRNVPDCELISMSSGTVGQNFKLKATEKALVHVMRILNDCQTVSSMSLTKLSNLPIPLCGMGRIGTFPKPMTLTNCIKAVKEYLHLPFIRVAEGVSQSGDSLISTVAVCAGSGSSVLKGVEADLYLTGEMSHHDVLDANHRNISVILCEHSNSERGYLKHLVKLLSSELVNVDLIVSSADKDPVCIV